MAKARKAEKCLIPGCPHDAVVRGQCRSCNRACRTKIATGETTWPQLEKLGLSTPIKLRKRVEEALAAALADRRKKRTN